MSKTRCKKKNKENPTADEIAEMAIAGEDVTKFFKYPGKMVPSDDEIIFMNTNTHRVNVDFAVPMVEELDAVATELNVPRQSLIKTWLRQSLDKYYENKKLRKA